MQCPLCIELESDEHVLKKSSNFAVIFNRYPYLAGHIMVVALQHIATLDDLSPLLRSELIEVINESQQLVHKALEINSSNIGINHGPNSGASIPDHLHVHIVPRNINDIGFYNLITKEPPRRDAVWGLNQKLRQTFADKIDIN